MVEGRPERDRVKKKRRAEKKAEGRKGWKIERGQKKRQRAREKPVYNNYMK